MRLPIHLPELPGQKYSCHGCGSCCRDFTVQLTGADLEKLNEQGWKERLGEEVVVEFRGSSWLKQTKDGACIFLGEDGLCRVHAEFGLLAKPLACQFFPFMLSPGARDTHVGVSFACGSVVANKGAPLRTHRGDIQRMGELLPASAPIPVKLQKNLIASGAEVAMVESALVQWLSDQSTAPSTRYKGLAWLITSLMRATLGNVRGEKLRMLMGTLTNAVAQELPLLDWPAPSPRAWKLLRQAVFARIEDPKIGELLKRGRMASVLGQLSRSRTWSAGRGKSPHTAGFCSVEFSRLAGVCGVLTPDMDQPFSQPMELEEMDGLLQRWLRASILGGRAWGSGLYGLPLDQGLGLILVNLLAALWLARFLAAGRGARRATLLDLQVAVGRVDRASGRAVWLGSSGERLRVKWLCHSDSLRLLAHALV